MAFTATEVITRVSAMLNDADGVRWTVPELVDWLNDALREVTLQAPGAVSKVVVLDLEEGTRQAIPDEYASLLRVICNVTATGQNVTARGATIKPITKAALDARLPGWQNATVLPASSTVTYIVDDPAVHRAFFVCPANDGNGQIEAVVAERPTTIAVDTGGDLLAAESYSSVIELDDMYLTAVVDFVMSKALAKDTTVPNAAARAQAHYAMFMQALGIKQQNETGINPATAPGSN